MYDSTKDALLHINKLQEIFNEVVIPELVSRANEHDKSKLDEPEKSTYDKYIPMLKEAKYGSDEYYKIKDEMAKTGLAHHYQANRHHPEHYENGVKDMTLFDVIEMMIDWYTASLRSDSGFEKGFQTNVDRYGISEELSGIMLNTYNTYLKDKTEDFKTDMPKN